MNDPIQQYYEKPKYSQSEFNGGYAATSRGESAPDYVFVPSPPPLPPPPPPTPPSAQSTGYIDPEDPDDDDTRGFECADENTRKGFIKRLYSTLAVQLTLCGVITAVFLFHAPTYQWAHRNSSLWWITLIVLFATMVLMVCFDTVRRKSPMNYIFLGLFTLVQSFLLGTVTAIFTSEEVIFVIVIIVAVCIGQAIVVSKSRWDFTVMGVILFVAVIILMVFGIIVRFIFGIIGAAILCAYLICDKQLMMGDSHKYSISPDEYIFAALNFYLDIINIFIYIWHVARDRMYPHRYKRSFI